MLQNAALLRKSAPWPPNISDENVFYCACHATCIFADPLQMSHTCHHFWKWRKVLTFRSLVARCTIPCACHAKQHLNVKKCSEPMFFFTPLTWKCALRRNGVLFFNISTSKSGFFVHFDFEICPAPQGRALFRHLSFQKWSETVRFQHFWLRNALRPATASTFSTSQCLKALRSWLALYILTSKRASCHNGVRFLISHLARWLCTRRFSEPTCGPSGPTKFRKTQWIVTFLPLRAPASSFFWLFSSLLIFSLLLFPFLALPTSVFPSLICSEVWLLNFHR